MHIHRHEHSRIFLLSLAQLGYTTLLEAAYGGHPELVRMLIDEFGCSVDEEDNVSVHPSVSTDSIWSGPKYSNTAVQ